MTVTLYSGLQLKLARMVSGMQQADLAAAAGISRQTLIRYETLDLLPQNETVLTLTSALEQLVEMKMKGNGTLVLEVPTGG